MNLRRSGHDHARSSVAGADTPFDSIPEAEYVELLQLAALLCGTQAALLTLLGENRQWYRASAGYKLEGTPSEIAFCAHAIRENDLFVVPDAALDERFVTNPLLAGEAAIRFYAGMPMFDFGRRPLGLLSVVDAAPRQLDSDQKFALSVLGRQLAARLALRSDRQVLEVALREKDRISAGLRTSEELFRAFMNASPFLSYIKDAAGRLMFYNKSFAKQFGVGEFTWLGRSDQHLWSPTSTSSFPFEDGQVLAEGRPIENEERLRGADGSVTNWRSFKFPCRDSMGNMLLAGVAVDISEEIRRKEELERSCLELERANEKLRRLSVMDELTELSNRRAFEERLGVEFSMARRRRRGLAVLLLDIDNFKEINDKFGHPIGDEVLRAMGKVIKTTVRLPDLPARYGGEEFVILLPESDEEGALGLARRLMQRIAQEQWPSGSLTISIGMAVMNESMSSATEMVLLADEALYSAKRQGKNRAELHATRV